MRLPTGSWNHAFAFAGLALTPALLAGLLGLVDRAPLVQAEASLLALSAPSPGSLRAPSASSAPWASSTPPESFAPESEPSAALFPLFREVEPGWSRDPDVDWEPDVDCLEEPELEPLEPEALSAARQAEAPAATRQAEGRLRAGQTIGQALHGHGLDASQVDEIVRSISPLYDFRRAPAGSAYDLAWDVDGSRLNRFCFRPDAVTSYEATRGQGGALSAREIRPDLRVVETEVAARIESSLYQAIAAAGESPALAAKIADVFAWDLDFGRDQRRGDTFRMVLEKHYRGDVLVEYGRVLAAEYAGERGTYRAFWFSAEGPEGKGRYYLEDGRSAEKTFLATPVEYTRISSGFNKSRKHPILGFTKAHNGTDFAAPTGTPVRAMADGVVSFAGRKGPSGNLVVIDHDNGLRTYYAHLSSFAKGMKRGRRVSQKTMIGRVGTTGRSTGPHLHLGVKSNGRWVDPQKLKIRRNDPLPPAQLPAFRTYSAAQLERLAALELPSHTDAVVNERSTRLAALQLASLSNAGAGAL